MKINLFSMLVTLFFVCKIPVAFGEQVNFESNSPQSRLVTSETPKSANLKVFLSSEGDKTYSIKLSGKWVKGTCKFQGTGYPYAVSADINFDGNLDVWVTGFTNSQGRSRCSDVWLFNPKNKKYEYNVTVSKINNLEVAPLEKKLEGGVFNCGCAGQCFFHDTYAWESVTLIKIARREQYCDTDAIYYQELILIDEGLKVVRQEKGEPDDNEYARRQHGGLHFLNWDTY